MPRKYVLQSHFNADTNLPAGRHGFRIDYQKELTKEQLPVVGLLTKYKSNV